MAGALLHDVGKLDAGSGRGRASSPPSSGRGPIGSVATTTHEAIGAVMVRDAGSDPLTVAMVADAPTLPADVRAALHTADDV